MMMDTTTDCSDRLLGRGVIVALPPRLEKDSLGRRVLLVADSHTWQAAGVQAQSLLQSHHADYHLATYSLGNHARPTMERVQAVMDAARAHGATGILAVGSGTVNDIAKLAAYRLALPYSVVATAASMNGYSSATASIVEDGHKTSHLARPPRSVIADTDILAAAPRRLSRAGLGDTLCRSTVEADCLLSHYLFGTDYPADIFTKLRQHEPYLLHNANSLRDGSPEYLEYLMQALLDAGDGMTRTGSSAIASQGEHMIAHTLEMLFRNEIQAHHGEVIAITATSMQLLQHKMLLGQPHLRPLPVEEKTIRMVFGKEAGARIYAEYRGKQLAPEQAEALNARLATEWPGIRAAIQAIMLSENALARSFFHAGIGCAPKDLGISPERYQSALTYAHLSRNRFTFLDLAVMMGRRV